MPGGIYDSPVIIERFLASVTASSLPEVFLAPCDLEVIGLMAVLGTAPGSTDGITVNISNSPTSQLGTVSAYNLWTATSVPSILGTATKSYTTDTTRTVIENVPYALGYPLPGPTGTKGYETAQQTSQITETPVTAPPSINVFEMGALVVPDGTYTDFNGATLVPANIVHAGDVLSFVVAAAGTNNSVGAAANLALSLLMQKR